MARSHGGIFSRQTLNQFSLIFELKCQVLSEKSDKTSGFNSGNRIKYKVLVEKSTKLLGYEAALMKCAVILK
ncbi:hypothetical protein, partial [Eubacterium callanderi]|uniref:hypothetical protein n=1 Tax=Eubacterium callanderi TaxID=53442 RepID=UPI003AF0945F